MLDNLICGHEVDTKFSLSGNWMIPREAIGKICLLLKADDNQGRFSMGVLRMVPAVLREKVNQDGKTGVSAEGKASIRWLLLNQQMPRNFLLDLDPQTRSRVMAPNSGKQRIRALFSNVTGRTIPRTAVLQVAMQKDALRRAREMKESLAVEGLLVPCAKYEKDRAQFVKFGFDQFGSDDWLCIKL